MKWEEQYLLLTNVWINIYSTLIFAAMDTTSVSLIRSLLLPACVERSLSSRALWPGCFIFFHDTPRRKKNYVKSWLRQSAWKTDKTSPTRSWPLCHTLMLSVEKPFVCESLLWELFDSSLSYRDNFRQGTPRPQLSLGGESASSRWSHEYFNLSLNRARQDAIIPLLKPIIGLDGTEIHEVAVPNDTAVIVSLSNSNRNSDLWGEGKKVFHKCSMDEN